jgi:hypothetical protein
MDRVPARHAPARSAVLPRQLDVQLFQMRNFSAEAGDFTINRKVSGEYFNARNFQWQTFYQ